MKQIVAAIAVFAILVAVVVFVLMRGEGEAPGTLAPDTGAPTASDAEAVASVEIDEAADGGVPAAAEEAAAVAEDGETPPEPASDGEATDAPSTGDEGPSFDVVRVERSGEAVMAGRASPGARVEVVTRAGVIAGATADERGEWVIVLEQPLAAGDHEIWLRAQGADGLVRESGAAVVMTVPQDGESEAGDVLAVTVPRGGDGDVVVLQAPAGGVGISGGGALVLESLSYDERGAVTLSGRAEPGAEVRPYIDGAHAGSVVAGAEGDWAITLDGRLDTGLHDLRIDQVASDGVVTARLETPLQRAAFAMPSSSEPLIVIQPGHNLWVIARHVYGRGVLYTQIFEANRAQIANPDLIYPGQIFVLPDAAGAGG